jgi:hypothetical protein
LLIEFSQNRAQHCIQRRNIPLHDPPDGLENRIQNNRGPASFASQQWNPLDVWMLLFVSLIYALCRLAENLKVAKNCVLEGARRKNSFGAMRGVLVYSPNALRICSTYALWDFTMEPLREGQRISGLSERRITT